MDSLPEGPASAYLRAVADALGPHVWSVGCFTWPDWYGRPPVEISIGLSGTHVVFWNPSAGGWFYDRVDEQNRMPGKADRLVAGAVVPRPDAVATAAWVLDRGDRSDHLPLLSGETPVPAGIQLTASQRRAVDLCDLTEDVALRLAVYSTTQAAAVCS